VSPESLLLKIEEIGQHQHFLLRSNIISNQIKWT